jgi:hypothetical protein
MTDAEKSIVYQFAGYISVQIPALKDIPMTDIRKAADEFIAILKEEDLSQEAVADEC